MIDRVVAMRVAKLAGEVLEKSRSQARVAQGYTRIDPVKIAESEDVDVLVRPLDRLLGAFLREERNGILLNSQRPSGMFHMTCAHELGHFYLGHLSTADEQLDYRSDASDAELEADQFAYSLMAPLWLVVHVMKAQRWGWPSIQDPAIVYQLSLRMGLSYTAMLWSLVRLNRLTSPQARTLAKVTPAELKRALVPKGTVLAPTQDVWHVGPSDKDAILEPRPQDHIVMDLPNHSGSGYLWSVSDARDEGYTLTPILIDQRESTKQAPGSKVLVGAIPLQRYGLDGPVAETDETAPAELTVQELQPWAAAPAEETEDSGAFSLRKQDEPIQNGLGETSRRRWTEAFEGAVEE